MSTKLVMLSSYLILCHPFLLLPSIFPGIRVFPNELALCIRWPKYWNFSFSICPSNEYSELISYRIYLVWSPCCPRYSQESSPAPQLKASDIWCAAFFMVQLSHPYMTTGKNIALTTWIFISKVMSLLLNMPSRFVIVFLPRSKNFSVSWLQSLSTVILDPKKIKFATVSTFPLSICHEIMKIKKVVWQGCLLSLCLFKLYAEHITRNARAGWVTSWNQDRQEKHEQPQICKWYHANGRKQRGAKEPLEEGEGSEWKSQLKTKH